MTKYSIGLLFILIFTSFYSCQEKKANNIVFFNQYIENDLNSVFINDDALYLILPLNSCSPCLEQTKIFLKDKGRNYRINLVLIAETNNEIELYSNELRGKFNIISDSKGHFFKKTFFEDFNPRVIVVENNKIIKNSSYSLNKGFESMKNDVDNFYK